MTNPERRPAHRRMARTFFTEKEIAWLLGIHIPFAFVARVTPALPTAYALSIFAVGVAFAMRGRTPVRAVVTIGYLCGAELLWRGTHARVFWEFGKYSILVLSILILLRFRRRLGRLEGAGLVYALCMIPSVLVLPYFDRGEVAFNISGPVSLGIAAFVLAGVDLEPLELRSVAAAILAPIVALGALAALSTFQVEDFSEVQIGGKATTAGIGPNQVSAMLGLGALLALILIFMVNKRWMRISLGAIGVWLLAQAMLSLSRGGFWGGLISILVASLLLLRERRTRRLVLASSVFLFPLFQFIVFPRLDAYTGGLLAARFSDTQTTGRDKIAQADLQAFKENPALGVGPGQSKYWHELTFRVSSSHVEYSRLLAEHGSLGVLALVLLAWMSLRRVFRPRHPLHRAMAVSFALWAGLFMGHSSMRLAAPAAMFALAGIGWRARSAVPPRMMRRGAPRHGPPSRSIRHPIAARAGFHEPVSSPAWR